MRIHSIFKSIFAVLFYCLLGLSQSVAQEEVTFESLAKQAILVDAKSGLIFYEKDANTPVPPASMSKLVTQAVVFDALKSGNMKLEQTILISENAWRKGGSQAKGSTMYAELKSQVSVENLLRGAIVQSANDACIALAEAMAGSEKGFNLLLARKAKELGMTQSTFGNSTGLPDPKQRMSVADLAKVARYIVNTHPEYFKIYSQPDFTWNKIAQVNRNPLLKDYPGADGMKTGYTKEAGYGMVGSATRDGRQLIMVIAGLTSIAERKLEAQKLLDWGFNQFKTIDIYEAGETVARARVWGGETRWVNLITPDRVQLALSIPEQAKADVRMSYTGPLLAPVKAGTAVGVVRILVEGKAISEVQLVTAGDIAAVDSMWQKAYDSALIMLFGS